MADVVLEGGADFSPASTAKSPSRKRKRSKKVALSEAEKRLQRRKNADNLQRRKAHEKTVEESLKENKAAERRGSVRCAKLPHYRAPKHVDKRHPLTPGFLNVNVCSNSKRWAALSPMRLGPVPHEEVDGDGRAMAPAKNLENLWQSCKVWNGEVQSKDGQISETFLRRRAKYFRDAKPHRRVVPRDRRVEFTYWKGRRMSYVEARCKLYCPLYESVARNTSTYKQLEALVESGQNVQIIGYDGFATDDYEAACFDEGRPFGHEHVIACMLQGLRPWESYSTDKDPRPCVDPFSQVNGRSSQRKAKKSR